MLSAKGRAVLSAICPTMFSEPAKLVATFGKRGGATGYQAGDIVVGCDCVRGLIKAGYVSPELEITTNGTLALQDALADAA